MTIASEKSFVSMLRKTEGEFMQATSKEVEDLI